MTLSPEFDALASTLKPCPFCGKPGELGGFISSWYCRCTADGCWASSHGSLYMTEADAITAWNTRTEIAAALRAQPKDAGGVEAVFEKPCPNCGWYIKETGALYCSGCSRPLPDDFYAFPTSPVDAASPAGERENLLAVALANSLAEQLPAAPFDITDGRHRYQPCPKCNATVWMALVSTDDNLRVSCGTCGFDGPGVPAYPPSSEKDKAAFDAWNNLPRSRLPAGTALTDE